MNPTPRQLMRERQELARERLDKEWKTWKRDPARGYIRQTPSKAKAWHIKANKELLKPATPKSDKHHYLKRIFGDNIEIKEISYTDKAFKYWFKIAKK